MKIWTSIFFLLWSVVASAHPTSYEKNASDHTATERVECGMFVGSIAYEERQLIESAKIVLDYRADLRGIEGSAQKPCGKRFHRTIADKNLKNFSFTHEALQAYTFVHPEIWVGSMASSALKACPSLDVKLFITYRNLRI